MKVVRVMAGEDSEGMSPADESLQHVEESLELNRNPELAEKDKPLKGRLKFLKRGGKQLLSPALQRQHLW